MTVEELIEKGLTTKLAWAVSTGRMTWSDAVARMAVEDKAKALIKKYSISRALAIQVAMGEADLVPYLKRRSLHAYRELNEKRSVWDEYHETGERLLVAIVGRQFQTVRISDVGRYDVSIVDEEGETSSIPKLSVKYAYSPEHKQMVRKLIRRDADYVENGSLPAKQPQHRFHLRDELLMLAIKRSARLKMKLCEGEALRAPVQWFSRFEFSVDAGDGASLVIFRHALIAGRVL